MSASTSPIESVLVENRVFPPPAGFAAKARIAGMEQYQALCALLTQLASEPQGEDA